MQARRQAQNFAKASGNFVPGDERAKGPAQPLISCRSERQRGGERMQACEGLARPAIMQPRVSRNSSRARRSITGKAIGSSRVNQVTTLIREFFSPTVLSSCRHR